MQIHRCTKGKSADCNALECQVADTQVEIKANNCHYKQLRFTQAMKGGINWWHLSNLALCNLFIESHFD